MEKTLILIRHGKAERRESSEGDFGRQLTDTGRRETEKMAKLLAGEGYRPDLAFASSAARAAKTAEIFVRTLKTDPVKFTVYKKLYYSSAKTILDHLYDLPPGINSIMIVAHNPGISDLVRGLSSGREVFMDNSQAAVFRYKTDQWFRIGEIEPDFFRVYKLSDNTANQ